MWKAASIGFVVAAMLVGPALAQRPSQAQINGIKANCRSDYPTYCSGVPTGGSAALECLQRNAGSVSNACRQSLAALNEGGSAGGAPPAAAPPPPATQQPMSRRQQMAMLRASCGNDWHAYCSGVAFGSGRGWHASRRTGRSCPRPAARRWGRCKRPAERNARAIAGNDSGRLSCQCRRLSHGQEPSWDSVRGFPAPGCKRSASNRRRAVGTPEIASWDGDRRQLGVTVVNAGTLRRIRHRH